MNPQESTSLVQQGASLLLDTQDPAFSWDQPLLEPQQFQPLLAAEEIDYRFFRVTEISQDKAEGYRLAMANVLSILNDSEAALAYLLNGTPSGLELYLGVVERGRGRRAHEASRQLKGALEGNFPGVQLKEVKQDDEAFNQLFHTSQHLGLVQGVPSFNEQAQTPEQQDFQGIERLANSLQGEHWQLLVVAEPGQDAEIRSLLKQVYELSTELSVHIKQTVQQSEGQSSQQSETQGTSKGSNQGDSITENQSHTQGKSETKTTSNTQGSSKNTSSNQGTSQSKTEGNSFTQTSNSSNSNTKNQGVSETRGSSSKSGSMDKNESRGTTSGTSTAHSSGESQSNGRNTSTSNSSNSGTSQSEGTSSSHSTSTAKGDTTSETQGKSKTQSQGTNEGESQSSTSSSGENTGLALTRERIDKSLEEMQKHLSETLLERLRLGLSKGMFKTAIYLSAPYQRTYQVLAQSVRSIFQGNQVSATPLIVHKLPQATQKLKDVLQLRQQPLAHHNSIKNLLAHSLPFDAASQTLQAATWLNTRELALFTGLPSRELPGVRIRQSVDFAVNTPAVLEHSLHLGHLVQHGRLLEHSPLALAVRDLNKHVFITGVTGSGKTTTCMRLLEASELPFMVIEPAKTEYRALYARGQEVDYYLPGREDITPFRLNPFELVNERQNLAGHISILTATLTTVYPMEAAMPQLVEEAIIQAYAEYGWDLHSGKNFFYDDPWADEVQGACWPTFSDMINQLDGLIKSKGMGQEFEEKYRGSLVARLTNLTLGVKGQMLNTRRSLDFNSLLDRKVVIELEELKSEQDKALLMGLIITRLAECMKERHRQDPSFQHLTLIEEAHRLLTRPEPGESDARKMGVEMFANLLAEVRKYGEGLIIADQIPNKLIPDVIKNTHTKIVHRLFAADDRDTIGDAMSLSDEQKDFLPLLQTGETIVYCGGWHGSVRAQIAELTQTDATSLPEEKLKEKGQQQLWQQHQRLFPRLAAYAWQDQQEFIFWLEQGQHLALLLKAWLLSGEEASKQESDIRRRNERKTGLLQEKYAKAWHCLSVSEKLQPCHREKIPELLLALMLDQLMLSSDYDESESQKKFVLMLNALYYSQDLQFKDCENRMSLEKTKRNVVKNLLNKGD